MRDETPTDENGAEKKTGVVVRDVYADSPGAKAGIKPGDRIVSINSEPVKDRLRLQEQMAALEPLKPA